mgnify:CR=1 FL=1
MIYKEKANKTYIIKRGKSTKSFLLINHTQNNISLGLNLGRKEDIIKIANSLQINTIYFLKNKEED